MAGFENEVKLGSAVGLSGNWGTPGLSPDCRPQGDGQIWGASCYPDLSKQPPLLNSGLVFVLVASPKIRLRRH